MGQQSSKCNNQYSSMYPQCGYQSVYSQYQTQPGYNFNNTYPYNNQTITSPCASQYQQPSSYYPQASCQTYYQQGPYQCQGTYQYQTAQQQAPCPYTTNQPIPGKLREQEEVNNANLLMQRYLESQKLKAKVADCEQKK